MVDHVTGKNNFLSFFLSKFSGDVVTVGQDRDHVVAEEAVAAADQSRIEQSSH